MGAEVGLYTATYNPHLRLPVLGKRRPGLREIGVPPLLAIPGRLLPQDELVVEGTVMTNTACLETPCVHSLGYHVTTVNVGVQQAVVTPNTFTRHLPCYKSQSLTVVEGTVMTNTACLETPCVHSLGVRQAKHIHKQLLVPCYNSQCRCSTSCCHAKHVHKTLTMLQESIIDRVSVCLFVGCERDCDDKHRL
ncbi:hypothetical protein J6590_091270 [Homalodisca vitripennis]|nr:hypothetical protein J6590_091270 [Homalodisca vitripennis]